MHQNHLDYLLKHRLVGSAPEFPIQKDFWGDLRISTSNKLDDEYMNVHITVLSILVMFEIYILNISLIRKIIEKSFHNIQHIFLI